MPPRPAFPDDVAAALERHPEARDRFAALPESQQVEWLRWIDRARGRGARAGRIDELIRRLVPGRAVEEEVAGPPPRNYWWVWLLILLLLVVGGLLAWYFLTRGSDKTTVPDVTGLRQPAAEQRIRDKHLDPLSRTGRSDRPLGVVFQQAPGAGTQMDKGQTVTIAVSAGPRTVVVPRLVGLSQGDAVSALTKAKLTPELHNVASKKRAGLVVGQKPPGGKDVPQGSTVILNVSTGTGGTGTTTATTTTTGITTTTTTATTAGTTTGGGGTSAAPATVPTVTSLAQTPALRRLNTLGLRPTVLYVQSSQPANRVVAQRPAAGTKLRRGSRVRVSVSMGPNPQAPVSVPDVTGEDQATAAQDLRSAGFRVAVLNRPTKDQSKDGVVVEQQPKAGSNIPGGLQVTVFVGRFSG
jgi:serine/threonine-protein kinase